MHLEHYGLSRDAVLRLVDAALVRGVSEIGITEHAYHFVQCRNIYPEDNAWIHRPAPGARHDWDLDTYVHLLESVRNEGAPVKTAMEWDFFLGRESELECLIRGFEWDFTLGAVHWLPGRTGGWWGIDLSEHEGEWQRRSPQAVYREYFGLLHEAIQTGFFDIIAHPDVVKVFGHRSNENPAGLYERLAATLAETGTCAEISTAGWRKRVGELYPAPRLLAALREHRVPIVISSDAHLAEDIGYEFPAAEGIVRNAGFATRCTFTHRRREEVPL